MESTIFNYLVTIWMITALVTFPVLLKFRAPYGRHTRNNWGRMVPNKLAWFIMELPAVLVFPILALGGPNPAGAYTWVLVVVWLLHYVNRSFIFPFRIRTRGKKMPLTIMLSAFVFNCVNGFFNGYWLGTVAQPEQLVFNGALIPGFVLFTSGMLINQKADDMLIRLRSKQEGYQIPKGWLFRLVSCPNHLGEIMEWMGFALMAWNLPALSFAVWTFANLAPRAWNHHQWYKEQFENYPKKRKALIPFIL